MTVEEKIQLLKAMQIVFQSQMGYFHDYWTCGKYGVITYASDEKLNEIASNEKLFYFTINAWCNLVHDFM